VIEFGLAVALVGPLMAAVFQFGYTYLVYNMLEISVRAGARYAASRVYDSPDATPSEAYTRAVRNVVLCGDPAGGKPPVISHLAPENVTVQMEFVKGAPAKVGVAISGYRIDGILGKTALTAKPRVIFPYVGSWEPM
jgi:hypothetical protein